MEVTGNVKTDCFYNKFSSYNRLDKTIFQYDRFLWLKFVEENLKFSPKQFTKDIS
jgi:hypothetical protein